MKTVDTRNKDLPKKDAILQEIRERFILCESAERSNRREAREDLRMLAGFDHWPAELIAKREKEGRPVLTINKLPSFTDQVLNENRMNRIAIKIKPNGSGATVEMAENFQGIIRNIESVSDAATAYQTAFSGGVNNGFGYFRVNTEYSNDSAWEQDIFIRRIRNPMTVYPDPMHVEHDGRDCRFYFVTEMMSRKEFEVRYPNVDVSQFAAGHEDTSWVTEDEVRLAEYWVKEPTTKKLYLLSDGRTVEGDEWDSIQDDLKAAEKWIHLEPNPQNPQEPMEVEGRSPEGSGYPETILNPTPTILKQRVVNTHKVVQYLVGGDEIIEGPTEWAGKFIPIVPVWGKEVVIDGERHLRGLIRFAKDPQRMYDYFRTAATETVALIPKAPYIMEERQVEGHEEEWGKVGIENLPYLLYKGVPGIERPVRNVTSQTAIGEITEANLANDEMKATTSLYDASLGSRGNEVSGVAIRARTNRGDVANFIFHDNLNKAIKFCGDILVDLIPRIIDTERQVVLMDEMEREKIITVNQIVTDAATGEEVIINDLSQGSYKVSVTTGPSFSTQREEASASMMDFVRTAPDSAKFVIDLVAENQDWPGAKKIANRLKKLLPQGIDEDGPLPEEPPSIDDIIKKLKANSIDLGNLKKQLGIVKERRELEGADNELIEAGATGALGAMGIGGD